MIIADTGFWVALFSPKDRYHQLAQQSLRQIILLMLTGSKKTQVEDIARVKEWLK